MCYEINNFYIHQHLMEKKKICNFYYLNLGINEKSMTKDTLIY